ncbi:MAG: DUF2271 domain-containing protein [Planctomycetes bacterium]|nr:DUF2271 domain-containing protein [Planctomycetota bacterium]
MHRLKSTTACVLTAYLAMALIAAPGTPAQTEGTTSFRVRTLPAGQEYDPRNILAIWVESSQGQFVKTLKKMADSRESHLYTWVSVSGRDTVDAITGATLRSHETHTVTWDGRDRSGNVTPDGEYRIRVEFTAEHEQGPLTPTGSPLQFTKGPQPFSSTPADQAYFRDMTISYAPDIETATLVARGSTWKYHDEGTDLHSTPWKSLDYDDSSWDSGPAELGYGDSPATTLSYGPDAADKHPCYYFRHRFQMTYAPESVKLLVQRDDGMVVYINGTEVARDNMPSGDTAYGDYASSAVGGSDESTLFEYPMLPSVIVPGENIIAVEVHQSDGASSDLSFDLELKATPPPSRPGFLRGDADSSGVRELTDAIYILNYLYLGQSGPACLSAADSNDDGSVDVSDAVTLLVHLFLDARPLPEPYAACGQDPSPDDLLCMESDACE